MATVKGDGPTHLTSTYYHLSLRDRDRVWMPQVKLGRQCH